MSDSNATSKPGTGDMPTGGMAGIGGSMTIGEMPRNQIMGDASAAMAGMTITEMPCGDMTETGSMTIGAMPSGQMMGAATVTMADMAMTEMPHGNMIGVDSMAGGMPSGQMMGVATVTMAGMAISEMPIGDMLSAERYGASKGGELPAMEITGEWRLTLSSISLKSGAQS